MINEMKEECKQAKKVVEDVLMETISRWVKVNIRGDGDIYREACPEMIEILTFADCG